jgi:dsDNA-binding SOS-regulon protein
VNYLEASLLGSMMQVMATQHGSSRPKATFQSRIDADAFDKLGTLADALRRSKSELVDFAVQELVTLTPEELSTRMLRTHKAIKGKGKG